MFIYNFLSLKDYLKARIEDRMKKNPQISLRAIAKRVGVSHTTLNNFLKKESSLSLEVSLKVANYLGLAPAELNYYLYLVAQNISPNLLQSMACKALHDVSVDSYPCQVDEAFYFNKEYLSYHYLEPDSRDMRTLVLLKEKNGGLSRNFFNRYYSPSKELSCVGYFKHRIGSLYSAYLKRDWVKGGAPVAISESNLHLRVEFSCTGFPTIYDYQMVYLDTNEVVLATLSFSEELCSLKIETGEEIMLPSLLR